MSDARRTHHDLVLHMETGDIIEFVVEHIEDIQRRVARDYGHDLVGHRLELYGQKRAN